MTGNRPYENERQASAAARAVIPPDPEWSILSPADIRSVLRGELEWRALGPDGQLIRAIELRDLLDEIERQR